MYLVFLRVNPLRIKFGYRRKILDWYFGSGAKGLDLGLSSLTATDQLGVNWYILTH